MARKKIERGSVEESQKAELSNRIWQIRQTLFDDNNRFYSQKILVNEQALSQICSGKRNAGIEIVQRILENITEISPDWLLLGKGEMLRENEKRTIKSYDRGEEDAQSSALQLRRENSMLYDHIKLLEEKVSSLEEQLRQEREKVESLSVRMNSEYTSY